MQTSMTECNSGSGFSLPQALEIPRDPQALLAQWDLIWSAYRRGQVPYRAVTTWCEGLTEAQGETLWEMIQRRAAMDEIAA